MAYGVANHQTQAMVLIVAKLRLAHPLGACQGAPHPKNHPRIEIVA